MKQSIHDTFNFIVDKTTNITMTETDCQFNTQIIYMKDHLNTDYNFY